MTEVTFTESLEWRELMPGTFLIEEGNWKEVLPGETPADIATKLGRRAFAFEIKTLQRAQFEWPDGKSQGMCRTIGETKTYYPEGIVQDYAAVVAEHGEDSTLAWNMRANGWERLVKSRFGNYQNWNENVEVL